MVDIVFFTHHADFDDIIDGSWCETTCCWNDTEDLSLMLSQSKLYSLSICLKFITLKRLFNYYWCQISCRYCLQAGFLVDSGPDYILTLRFQWLQRQQGHCDRHACREGQHNQVIDEAHSTDFTQAVHSHCFGHLDQQRRPDSFWLECIDIATSTDTMC